ncbi:hypothetical protein A1O3_04273 [Capronia epimyces CBS 606.96]|uniref:Uncharacterized protein n=1 Tax=Capronia epimyces CBS 606.96 TaxID=1182542 RepID=W9YYE4_9EURO|nr:uncharacterized protein A1O3_04273 [Capronia epimyces CBS 606.96]EXJ87314.1 hypothetical protein A1O3_04273 [Capronia epimyces CBS 606.96]
MARNKNREIGRRHASATPQRPHRPVQNFIDLTQSDPWVPRSTALPVRPTPLSPSFSGRASTVAVPQDPKSNPAYLFQQLALAKNRASSRPVFSSKLEAEETAGESAEDGQVETPTPGQKEVKEKRKKKSKEKKEKQQLEEAEAEANKKPNRKKEHNKSENGKDKKKSKKVKEKPKNDMEESVEDKRPKEVKYEPKDQEPGTSFPGLLRLYFIPSRRHLLIEFTVTQSRKRKRQYDEEISSRRAGEIEANAINKLRESLPTARIARVTKDLQRETGVDPTDMAVLVTTARETILDLARQQLEQTERSFQTIQTELLRMLKKQNDKLARLEGKRVEDSSDEEGDNANSRAPASEACPTN